MKKLVLLAASFCTALALCSIIFADPPKTISFQGRITDNFGNPITERGEFKFIFQDGINSPTSFSTYAYVNRGLYSVNINVTDLSDIDFGSNVSVAIYYNDNEMGTTNLTASPYAFVSESSTYASTAAYSAIAASATYARFATSITGSIDGNLIANNTAYSTSAYKILVSSAQFAGSANSLVNTATATYARFATYITGSIDGSKITGSIDGNLIANNTAYSTSAYKILVASAQFAAAIGADLAEIYASKENLEPGDVVEISLDADNNIEKSKSPDSPRVAGVVSTNPGLLINSKELGGYRLALVGKVPVKVTNEGGNIMRGDLLTTSSTHGHAKKATNPKPGRIIGKALENFNSTEGTILVLVNLQ
ncbi:MAG: hypothetical protein LBS38_01550 [Endomicrobium sp.]|jgi:hypothetical protein|nr:hypothetical protein [Endomicrobium sp.]